MSSPNRKFEVYVEVREVVGGAARPKKTHITNVTAELDVNKQELLFRIDASEVESLIGSKFKAIVNSCGDICLREVVRALKEKEHA